MAEESMYPVAEKETPDNEAEGEDNQHEGQTALLDKSVFPKEPNPGDICNFRVVKVYEDEVEVEYVPEAEEEKSEMSQAMGKMDAMAGGSEEE